MDYHRCFKGKRIFNYPDNKRRKNISSNEITMNSTNDLLNAGKVRGIPTQVKNIYLPIEWITILKELAEQFGTDQSQMHRCCLAIGLNHMRKIK